MKTKILISLLLLGLLLSCNNNKTVERDDKNSVKKDTIVRFDPEEYNEEIKDSILDTENNIRVIIKKASRMDKYISQTYDIDSISVQKLNYRDNSINIKITSHDETIFDSTFVKENFVQIGDDDFLKKSILYNAWFENYDKENQIISMSLNVLVPDTDWAYNFSIKVEKNGNSEIVLEEIE